MVRVSMITAYLQRLAPARLAESWDNVGLLIGDARAKVSRVMTCLTVTEPAVREAAEGGAGLIVAHHPVLMQPVQRLTADDPAARVLLELIRAGMALYSLHTSFDSAAEGINQMLAELIGLGRCRPLRPAPEQKVKLVVFVPADDLERVSRALFEAGAGVIGQYRECSFRVAGRGTFFGSEQTRPAVGQAGRREEVDEWRLEVVCPRARLGAALAAMRAAHSYEEPACDVYSLVPGQGQTGGARHGWLEQPIRLAELADRVGQALDCRLVRVVGPANQRVEHVAVACGSGATFLPQAARCRCQVLLTGEATFHRQLQAQGLGLAMILAGHFETERFAVERLAGRLKQQFDGLEQVWACRCECPPAWVHSARLGPPANSRAKPAGA